MHPWRPVVIGTLVIFAAINLTVLGLGEYFERLRRTNLMQPALVASGATSVPRYDWSTGEDQERYWRFIPDARKTRVVVLDGMSQQYAINDQRSGDRITAEILDDTLGTAGLRVFGIAAPNLNNEEFLLHLVSLASRPETAPALLVYGVCFDKMRNVDARPGIQAMLRTRPDIAASWQQVADSAAPKYPALAKKMARTLADARSNELTRLDQRIERRVIGSLEDVLPLVRHRADLRSFLLDRLYLLRNAVFRIKTSTKRPMLPDRYALNRDALVAALRLASRRHIPVLLYVVPLNPRAETPYVEEEYVAFKQWLERTADEEGARFANLESVVPLESWGLLYGQPDFKHFKEEGHAATARALLPLIRSAVGGVGPR
ncbi:MAG: SGNH/GDSL hydrolase family protein [Gemmatimonadota bacterium]